MIESFWHEDASCWMHVFEAEGSKLVLQENGVNGANLLLERNGKGSEYLGAITYSDGGVEKFIEFMEKFEKGKK